MATLIKGDPVRFWDRCQAIAARSDNAADCRDYNAMRVEVLVTGTDPSADLTILGSNAYGGQYVALSDPQAVQYGINSSFAFDLPVGAPFVRAELSNVEGTFGGNQGFLVIGVPYVAPAITSIVTSNIVVLPLATDTTAGRTSRTIVNPGARGVALFLRVTALQGSPQIDQIQLLLVSSAGFTVTVVKFSGFVINTAPLSAGFLIYPAAASSADWRVAPVQAPLPRFYQIFVGSTCNATGTNMTYTVEAQHLL